MSLKIDRSIGIDVMSTPALQSLRWNNNKILKFHNEETLLSAGQKETSKEFCFVGVAGARLMEHDGRSAFWYQLAHWLIIRQFPLLCSALFHSFSHVVLLISTISDPRLSLPFAHQFSLFVGKWQAVQTKCGWKENWLGEERAGVHPICSRVSALRTTLHAL